MVGIRCPEIRLRRLSQILHQTLFLAVVIQKNCQRATANGYPRHRPTDPVLTAASGGEGLELASKHSVDVVILDYFMPEMNGQEVAIEMRRLRPQAPIIMLSGAVDVPEQGLRWVDAFIAKDCFTV